MAIEVQKVIQVPDKKSYVLFGDTDSFGANVEPLVKGLLKGKVPTKDWKREDVDKICQKILEISI